MAAQAGVSPTHGSVHTQLGRGGSTRGPGELGSASWTWREESHLSPQGAPRLVGNRVQVQKAGPQSRCRMVRGAVG